MSKKKPKGTDEYIHRIDIVVPHDFRHSHPSEKKIREYTERYERLGYLDKPITVISETNEKGLHNEFVIMDGYIRYIIASKYELNLVPIKYIDINDVVIN